MWIPWIPVTGTERDGTEIPVTAGTERDGAEIPVTGTERNGMYWLNLTYGITYKIPFRSTGVWTERNGTGNWFRIMERDTNLQ